MPEFVLTEFAPDFNSTANATIGTSQTYGDLKISGSSTLTFNSGATISVMGVLTIGSGSTLYLDNCALHVHGDANILGTLTSNNAADTIIFYFESVTSGTWSIAGSLTLNDSSLTHYYHNTSMAGTGTITVNGILYLTSNLTINTTLTITGTGSMTLPAGLTLTIGANPVTWTTVGTTTVAGTITINTGQILIVGFTATLSHIIGGTGTFSVNNTFVITIPAGLYQCNLDGAGTIDPNGVTIQLSASVTWSIATMGLISFSMTISNTFTLTIATRTVTWKVGSINAISATMTVTINTGITLVQAVNLNWGVTGTVLTGVGTYSVNTAISATIGINMTTNLQNLAGAGTFIIADSITLTIATNMTITIATVQLDVSTGNSIITVNTLIVITFTSTTTLSCGTPVTTNQIAGAGELDISGTLTLQAITTNNINWNISTIGGSGTLTCTSLTLRLNNSVTWNISTISGSPSLTNVSGTNTITFAANVAWSVTSLSITAGSLALQINGGFTLTQQTNTLTMPANTSISNSATGTISITSAVTVSASQTWNIGTIAGAGTLTINNSLTLTLGTTSPTITVAIITSGGTGTLSIGAGLTVTFSGTTSSGNVGTASTSGAIAVSGTLTITAATTWLHTGGLSGAGTLSINGSQTVTYSGGGNLTLVLITGNGTIKFTGAVTFTIPVGNVINIKAILDSTTTNSNFTVNGTFETQTAVVRGTTDALLTPPTSGTISGTGIWIASVGSVNTATNAISYASSTINAGADGANSATGSVNPSYLRFAGVTASVAGKYSMGIHNTTAPSYQIFCWLYIGNTSLNNSMAGTLRYSDSTNNAAQTLKVRVVTGSAGNLTFSSGAGNTAAV